MKVHLVAAFVFFSGAIWAQEAPFENVSAHLEEDYKILKNDLTTTEEERRKVLGELYSFSAAIKKARFHHERLIADRADLERKIKTAAKSVANLDQRLAEQKVRLKKRLRVIYKFGGQGVLRLLFSSASSIEIDRNVRLIKAISAKDYELIRSFQKNKSSFHVERGRLRDDIKRLARLEKEIQREEAHLAAQIEKKKTLLGSIESKQVQKLEKLRAMREQSGGAKMEAAFFETKGALPSPVKGRLAQAFGVIEDPEEKTKLRFKGHFYATRSSEQVSAVHSGEVAWTGYVEGYNKVVILDHGEHYYSVYGNVGKISVKAGDRVAQGQTVAETGSWFERLGQGLYFEIRHFSDPLNPAEWLGGNRATR